MQILLIVIGASIITLGFVFVMFRRIKRIEVANKQVNEISEFIHEGSMAFLKREFKVIIPFAIGVAIVLSLLGLFEGLKDVEGIGWKAGICFAVGSLFSGLAGFIGMKAATKANARTTSEAARGGISAALKVAFTGGSILGLSVAALGLLGLTGLFLGAFYLFDLSEAVHVISGYGLGCSMIALFGRVGGGIYTKAADVGADLVGKVEAGIPEDDPRNPAVIADNVGDNVGDIAGMGSDLCESYVGSLISACSLGFIVANNVESVAQKNLIFVFLVAGIGLISSLLAVVFVRMKKWEKPQLALTISTYVATAIVIIGTLLLSIFYLKNSDGNPTWGAFGAVLTGLIVGVLVGEIAEWYTSSDFKQVKEIAAQSQTGHATNIIAGFSSGMQSTALTIAVLGLGIAISYFCFKDFGIGLAAVGMLSTVGITVSVDGYGPISDNAGGIAEMSGMDHKVREITDKLDSIGNTTAAIGKGFCIGSATLTALALFMAYKSVAGLEAIDIIKPQVMIGLLVGAMLPYLFTSLTIKSVGKAANKMIEEVRTQFKDDPGIMAGTSKPNYSRCIDISTKAALKEMIIPAIIAIVSPIIAGFVIGQEGLGGLLAGGLASAIMLAVFMANAGGAWDNAKKFIEGGMYGGKGSETHKAAVTGDTVGDPFKDTAGPAMDILIKLMSIISLIIAPVLIKCGNLWDLIVNLF